MADRGSALEHKDHSSALGNFLVVEVGNLVVRNSDLLVVVLHIRLEALDLVVVGSQTVMHMGRSYLASMIVGELHANSHLRMGLCQLGMEHRSTGDHVAQQHSGYMSLHEIVVANLQN